VATRTPYAGLNIEGYHFSLPARTMCPTSHQPVR